MRERAVVRKEGRLEVGGGGGVSRCGRRDCLIASPLFVLCVFLCASSTATRDSRWDREGSRMGTQLTALP